MATLNNQGDQSVFLQDKGMTLSYPGDMDQHDIGFHLNLNEYEQPMDEAAPQYFIEAAKQPQSITGRLKDTVLRAIGLHPDKEEIGARAVIALNEIDRIHRDANMPEEQKLRDLNFVREDMDAYLASKGVYTRATQNLNYADFVLNAGMAALAGGAIAKYGVESFAKGLLKFTLANETLKRVALPAIEYTQKPEGYVYRPITIAELAGFKTADTTGAVGAEILQMGLAGGLSLAPDMIQNAKIQSVVTAAMPKLTGLMEQLGIKVPEGANKFDFIMDMAKVYPTLGDAINQAAVNMPWYKLGGERGSVVNPFVRSQPPEKPEGWLKMAEKLAAGDVEAIPESTLKKFPDLANAVEQGKVEFAKATESQAMVKEDVAAITKELNLDPKLQLAEHQKSLASIAGKAARKFMMGRTDYDVARMNDLARAAIVVPDVKAQGSQIIKTLADKGWFPAEDYGKEMWGGYVARHFIKQLPNGQHAELQVHTPETIDYKFEESDEIYRAMRPLLAKGIDKLSPKEFKALSDAATISKDRWDKIYSKLGFSEMDLASSSATLADSSRTSRLGRKLEAGTQPSLEASKASGGLPSDIGATSIISPSGVLRISRTTPPSISSISKEGGNVKEKPRGFSETVKAAPTTEEQVREAISSQYRPITNQETLDQAQALIDKDPDGAYKMATASDLPTPLSNAVAMKLILQYQNEGKFEQAIKLVDSTAERNTRAGQAVQALSMYERLSAEGILRYVQSIVKKAQKESGKTKLIEQMEALKDEKLRTEFAKKHGIPYLSEDFIKEMIADAQRIQGMVDGRPKSLEMALLLNKISHLIPKTLSQKISALQTMAQLLNPKTFIRNILGNLGFQGLENISQALGTAIDVGVSQVTGERAMGLPNLGTQARGAAIGLKEGTQEALAGVDLLNLTSKFEIPKGTVFENPVLQSLEKTLSISLRATDRAFYKAAMEDSLREQMVLAKVTAPTPEMINTAHLEGLYRTFNDENALSRAFVGIKRALNFGGQWGLGDMVLKYPRTPANILARGIEYSPFGFMQTVYMLGKAAAKHDFNQREFVKTTSRALLGSILLVGTGIMLAKLGILRGKKEGSRNARATEQLAGLRDYQINTTALLRFVSSGMDPAIAAFQPGDLLVSYDWFQPASINLAMGANIGMNEETSAVSVIANAIMDSTQTLVDQPLMQGIKKIAQGSNLVKGALSTIQDIPASFTPTLFNQIKQLSDNSARNLDDPNYFKEIYNKAAYRIPFLSQTLPEQINVLGQVREIYQDNSNNPFNVFLNPAFVNRYNPAPSVEMVLDIWARTGETIQMPRIAPKYIKSEGQRIDLDAQTQALFQQYIGHKTDMLFTALANNPGFMRAPDDLKAKKLQGYLTDIYNEAKFKVLGVRPRGR